jgi:transposase
LDETGLRAEGEGMWVHVAGTEELAHYYAVHEKRGMEATKEIGILPLFKGVAMHDGLSSYWHYERCAHALRHAHHLRGLTFVEEEHEQERAGRMKALLLEIEEAVVREEAAFLGETHLLAPEKVERSSRSATSGYWKQGLRRTRRPSGRASEGGPSKQRARIW